jgi:hypothetical protein
MDLREAADLVLAWGRQHEAAMTLAQAVADVAALEADIQAKRAAAKALADEHARADADLRALKDEGERLLAGMERDRRQAEAAAKASSAAVMAAAMKEADAEVAKAKARAEAITASAKADLAQAVRDRDAAHLSQREAEAALAVARAAVAQESDKLESIRAAIKAATQV